MVTRRKAASTAKDKVLYIEGLLPRMQPIIPEQAAQEGGTRAIQLASHIISTDEFSMLQTNSITEAELAERLSEIAEEYWPGRRWAERLGPNDLRDTLMPVADATTQLLQILEKSPNYAR